MSALSFFLSIIAIKLKGLSMSEAKTDGKKYIDLLSLQEKTNVRSAALSGGMKRKLHLAMALTGSSKVRVYNIQ